jgi:two-component system invasion response regulator UvrY
LKRVIGGSFPRCYIGDASSAVEAMNAIWNHVWDLALLDISTPGRGSLELLKEIRAERPRLPVLMLTMYPEDQFALRALRAGASGYLSKSAPAETLLDAVGQMLAGGRFITRQTAALLAAGITADSSRPLHARLSDRELDIMLSIGRGQSVGDIAQRLNLSVKTVSTYRARVRAKTGLRNNAEIVQYVMRSNLVDNLAER